MITMLEVFYLIFMNQAIMINTYTMPLIFHTAGRDGWISHLLSIPVGFLLFWGIYRLRLSFTDNFHDYMSNTVGKIPSILLKMIFTLYFIFLASFSMAAVLDVVKVAFLPLTPLWALAIFFMVGCLLLAAKSYKIIAMVTGVLVFVASFSGIIFAIFDSAEKEIGHLLPILEYGWRPVGNGVFEISSIWIEMIFLLFIPIDMSKKKTLAKVGYWNIFYVGIAGALLISGALMTFGLGQAKSLNYPSLEVVRFLSFGFIDRFDVYGEMLIIFGTYIHTSFFMRIGLFQIFPTPKPVVFTIALLGMGATVTALAMYMSHTHFTYIQTLHWYSYGTYLLPLPFLILGLGFLRRKKALGKS